MRTAIVRLRAVLVPSWPIAHEYLVGCVKRPDEPVVVGKQDPSRAKQFFQRDHRAPDPVGHEHSCDLSSGRRSASTSTCGSTYRTFALKRSHAASRGGSSTGSSAWTRRRSNDKAHPQLIASARSLPPRVEEDQDGVAGPALLGRQRACCSSSRPHPPRISPSQLQLISRIGQLSRGGFGHECWPVRHANAGRPNLSPSRPVSRRSGSQRRAPAGGDFHKPL